MLRMVAIMVMMLSFEVSGLAANLVSLKLCSTKDYNAATRDCAEGKSLQAGNLMIDTSAVDGLEFLTIVKTTKVEELLHVWIGDGKSSEVVVYDAIDRTLRDATETELAWLKERNIEGARILIKTTASESPAFRMRSHKTLARGMKGNWKVQVYDSTSSTPLGEMTFTLTVSDRGISN